MSDAALNQVLRIIAESRNYSGEQLKRLGNYSKSVALTESNGDPRAKQHKDGPGRGKYQFEMLSGSGRNMTAVQRLENFQKKYKQELAFDPADLEVLQSKNPDFSQLSERAQDAVFFSDLMMGPVPVEDLANGKLEGKDAWIKYHWAGSEKDRPAREAHWDKTQEHYSPLAMPDDQFMSSASGEPIVPGKPRV